MRLYNRCMLVVLSGVSGVGKNTVIQKLLEKFPNMHFFKSATTRAPRPGETLYDFYSPEEFEQKRIKGDFFEVEESHGFWYATQISELNKIVDNPQDIFIKDIDVHGAAKLKEYFEDKGKAVLIFIDAPDDVLHERLIGRGESEERIAVRLSRGKMERQHIPFYDLVIENLDLDKTVDIIEKYLREKLAEANK